MKEESTMKLNKDCVRDLLLYCEKALTLDDSLSWNHLNIQNFCDEFPKYSKSEIAYTLFMLEEADFISANVIPGNGGICEIIVFHITYSGHEFIDTIRSNKIWDKVSSAISSVGSASLPVIQDLATHFLINALKN